MLRYLLVFLFLASPSYAAGCYSQAEAEAEQGIRIHSELMVIGLNCQAMGARQGMSLYADYRNFTARYSDVFGSYDETLIGYFKKRGYKKPEAALNTLRTEFANKISKDAANMRPDIFCARYAPRIEQASAMSRRDLRKWASTIHPSHPVSKPLCKG